MLVYHWVIYSLFSCILYLNIQFILAAEEKNEAENASPPGRLLDDLFRKTKAVPCIYWLPLTEEQVIKYFMYILMLIN